MPEHSTLKLPSVRVLKHFVSLFAAFSTKRMAKWHQFRRTLSTMGSKVSATHAMTMARVMCTSPGIYSTTHCSWAMNHRLVRAAVDVVRPMNCLRKVAKGSTVTVASAAVRMVHALRQFPISKQTAITSYKTMTHRWTQTIQWWRDASDVRLYSKMAENRPLHHGNDTGYNCIPILCSISHRNRSKGKSRHSNCRLGTFD